MALVSDTRIFILLCTCDGAEHLDEQLASYEAQTHENWALWVSDDGSQDGTLEILRSWQERWQGRHEMRLFSGARQGAAANFMSLLTHPELPRCTVALSDQDDVWHPDKLARALDTLAALPSDQPGLYGAQSIYTDADLHPTGRSVPPLRGPSFTNALTQNSVSGHSATLNPATLDLVRQAGVPTGIPFHDWWLYQLVTGAGGWVLVDTQAVLFYRQHENNVLGAHLGRNAFRQRLTMVADGSYGDWIAANLAALDQVSHLLSPNHANIVCRILNKRRGLSGFGRWPVLACIAKGSPTQFCFTWLPCSAASDTFAIKLGQDGRHPTGTHDQQLLSCKTPSGVFTWDRSVLE